MKETICVIPHKEDMITNVLVSDLETIQMLKFK